MKLNHLNLSVPDVAHSARFFTEFFGLRCTEQKGTDTLSVLYDENGFALILSNFDRKMIPSYPKDFHLGFIQENEKQVNEIYERLQAAGYEVNPPRRMHGSWGFYFTAPGKIEN
jgi:lactoylglutathione lyase